MANMDSASSWRATLASYWDKRLAWVFMLGCASGFPWTLVGSNMTGWLTDAGFTRTSIGLFGSIFVVYALNFIWAPLLDRVKLPWLYTRLGQRRSWILLCQLCILACTLAITQLQPSEHLLLIALLALGITTASATQDVAIDAFRIDSFSQGEQHKLPQASAMAVMGWWTGYSVPGYLAFINADAQGWNTVYLGMAGFVLLCMLFTLLAREPHTDRDALQQKAAKRQQRQHSSMFTWLYVTLVEPFAEFFRRNQGSIAVSILLFVFLFNIGQAFLGRMSVTFYRQIGFSNEEIGHYSKLIGWGATLSFTFVSSAINARFGIIKGLFIGGVAMSVSNLMFSWIAVAGPNTDLLLAAIVVDNFTSAFASVAFVSFLSLLTGQAFSATQYALLASLGNLGRTTLASFSGALVDWLDSMPLQRGLSDLNTRFDAGWTEWLLGFYHRHMQSDWFDAWSVFFAITAVMVVPSLVLLWRLRHAFDDLLKQQTRS